MTNKNIYVVTHGIAVLAIFEAKSLRAAKLYVSKHCVDLEREYPVMYGLHLWNIGCDIVSTYSPYFKHWFDRVVTA